MSVIFMGNKDSTISLKLMWFAAYMHNPSAWVSVTECIISVTGY